MQSGYSSGNILLHISWKTTGNTAGLPELQEQTLILACRKRIYGVLFHLKE